MAGKPVTLNTDAGAIETLALNSATAANQVTLADTDALVTATGKIVVSGSQALTVVGSLAAFDTLTAENTNTAGFTINSNAAVAADTSVSKVAATLVDVKAATGDFVITVNEGTAVKLSVDNDTTKAYQIDNVAGDLTKGTLKLNVAESQTTQAIVTGAKVGTLELTADTKNITITSLAPNAALDQIKLAGSKNVVITTLNYGTDDVFTAAGYTGVLTVTDTAAVKGVVIGGEGNDSLTVTSAVANTIVRGGNGNDTINAGAAAVLLYGDAGNDVLTGGAGNDTINGGADNDTIAPAGGADVLTGGAGTDTFRFHSAGAGDATFAAAANSKSITDFVAGTDKISLTTTADGFLTGLTFTGASNVNMNTAQTITTAADLAAVYAGITAIAASTNATAQAVLVTVSNGAAAGSYLYINDNTATAVAAEDALIKITGVTGTITAADFVFA